AVPFHALKYRATSAPNDLSEQLLGQSRHVDGPHRYWRSSSLQRTWALRNGLRWRIENQPTPTRSPAGLHRVADDAPMTSHSAPQFLSSWRSQSACFPEWRRQRYAWLEGHYRMHLVSLQKQQWKTVR